MANTGIGDRVLVRDMGSLATGHCFILTISSMWGRVMGTLRITLATESSMTIGGGNCLECSRNKTEGSGRGLRISLGEEEASRMTWRKPIDTQVSQGLTMKKTTTNFYEEVGRAELIMPPVGQNGTRGASTGARITKLLMRVLHNTHCGISRTGDNTT